MQAKSITDELGPLESKLFAVPLAGRSIFITWSICSVLICKNYLLNDCLKGHRNLYFLPFLWRLFGAPFKITQLEGL